MRKKQLKLKSFSREIAFRSTPLCFPWILSLFFVTFPIDFHFTVHLFYIYFTVTVNELSAPAARSFTKSLAYPRPDFSSPKKENGKTSLFRTDFEMNMGLYAQLAYKIQNYGKRVVNDRWRSHRLDYNAETVTTVRKSFGKLRWGREKFPKTDKKPPTELVANGGSRGYSVGSIECTTTTTTTIVSIIRATSTSTSKLQIS